MLKKTLFILITFLIADTGFSQVTDQILKYRNDPKGNIDYRKEGVMDGNQIRTLFYNDGEVGHWPDQPSGEWPKGTGHSYLDGVAVLIASEINTDYGIVHPLQTAYREHYDRSSSGEPWGLEPIPGYSNPDQVDDYPRERNSPAINTNPHTWPQNWPAALDLTTEWNGFWYGYFGRGVNNSDFETFFAMDDSRDKEWAREPFNFYPVSSDSDRAGLGLRVEVRGFQWSHVLAEDIVFWHYDIVNISDLSYPNTFFGFYTDCGVGGTDDSEDDDASFDKILDMAYCFDDDGLGLPNAWITGYYGYAYLESPGNATNGINDDDDRDIHGVPMVDERRDDGIDNDGDWVGYSDLNSNGVWDAEENEPLNDDVGEDGVGPFDPQYLGPDEGEGNGIPTDGEPKFDKTDKDESDQIGLTAVSIYRLGQNGTGGGWPKDDESMWLKMSSAVFDTSLQRANISMVFASGPFPLNQGLRERFSMALLFGENLDELIFNKETVQEIYNANYNFSKPPLKPTLTAVAGDKKVFLYWNKIAEESRDAFMGFENNDPTQGAKKDFEGYMIYRSTEAEFNDIKVITDSKGSPVYWKPLVRYDLNDSIKGPDPIGVNGAHFWRGDDTGLRHSYVDNEVQNGQTYYYACISYDMGDPNRGTKGLQPTECTKIIQQDFAGNIQFVDYNCAVVVPNSPVAGYVPPQIIGDTRQVVSGVGTGSMSVNILNPNAILDGAQYNVIFKSSDDYPLYKTLSYDVVRTFNNAIDTIVVNEDSTNIGSGRISQPFDGMALTVLNDTSVTVVDSLTGWVVGSSNLAMFVTPDPTLVRGIPWPADYEIRFFDTPQDTCFLFNPPTYRRFPINLKVWNNTEGKYSKVAVKDNDGSQSLTIGDLIQILEFQGENNYRYAWDISYDPPFDPNETPVEPVAGDKFRISTLKTFKTGDLFSYSTLPVQVDKSMAKDNLSRINVVPNPYLGAATWEKRNLNSSGRGERKIDFINLPAQCTVRIYTITGALIKTLSKDSGFSDGSLSWDLVTEDGMDAAYGVYLYHVDAPGVGEHIGKFALIK
jgi:hypothetical protein